MQYEQEKWKKKIIILKTSGSIANDVETISFEWIYNGIQLTHIPTGYTLSVVVSATIFSKFDSDSMCSVWTGAGSRQMHSYPVAIGVRKRRRAAKSSVNSPVNSFKKLPDPAYSCTIHIRELIRKLVRKKNAAILLFSRSRYNMERSELGMQCNRNRKRRKLFSKQEKQMANSRFHMPFGVCQECTNTE